MIKNIIKQRGSLPLDTFLDIALTEFYNQENVIGKAGHFITSPEISNCFGRRIAFEIIDFIDKFKKDIRLVELGSGNGRLFRDILDFLKKTEYYSKIKECIIIEKSHKLIALQRKLLPEVNHYGGIYEIPENMPVFVFSNEFLDAIPIKQFVYNNDNWYEIVIINNANNDLELAMASTPSNIKFAGRQGNILELPVEGLSIFTALYQKVKKTSGQIMTIDYGFIDHNFGFTLQAIQYHKKVNILYDPGKCDITHLVQFDFFAKLAKYHGFSSLFMLQKEFLEEKDTIKRLTDTDGMGNFVVMVNTQLS